MTTASHDPPPARSATVREGYAAWAATYDDFSNPMITVADRVLRQGTPPTAEDRVCELGCGTGRNAPRVRATGAEYVGVDSSPEMLARALQHSARNPDARFVQADLTDAAWTHHGPFDLILICLVLEHVEQLAPVFERCRQATTPGAHLWIVELHAARHAAGVGAHVETPEGTLHLPSFAHARDDYARALAATGWAPLTIADLYASPDDEARCPKLTRYRDQPVLTEIRAQHR